MGLAAPGALDGAALDGRSVGDAVGAPARRNGPAGRFEVGSAELEESGCEWLGSAFAKSVTELIPPLSPIWRFWSPVP